jgi:ribosome-binding factor A
MGEFRTERVGSLIREKISGLIAEGRIKDKRVSSFLSITRVTVSRDLSYAEVYVSNIRTGANIEQGARGLQSAAGFIQSCLGASMHIKKIPRLRFHADTSIREGFDMIKKIEELSAGGTDASDSGESVSTEGLSTESVCE